MGRKNDLVVFLRQNNPMKGKISPNRGKTYSDQDRQQISRHTKEAMSRDDVKEKMCKPRRPFTRKNSYNVSNRMLEKGCHPSQIKVGCLHCHQETSVANFKRWHGDNCKGIIHK